MNVDGKDIRSIWLDAESDTVRIIDQRKLPHRLVIERIDSISTMVRAIRDRHVCGTDLLYAAGAYGVFLAAKNAPASEYRSSVDRAADKLQKACPSSFGLAGGIQSQLRAIRSGETQGDQVILARQAAAKLADDNVNQCVQIGQYGLRILDRLRRERNSSAAVNILTDGYAGALASVDVGTATAPIFAAQDAGIRVHVWIPESRPHMEGARLVAWEFEKRGVEYTVVPDSTTGYLLCDGRIDLVLASTQRVTTDGVVSGYSGAYLNALASADNSVPFYVALTSCAIDWDGAALSDGATVSHDGDESVRFASGLLGNTLQSVLITPRSARTLDAGHDTIRPQLVTGLITDRGICRPDTAELLKMYPEKRSLSSA